MASTTFISRVTKIAREWLQDVNDCVYGPTAPTTTLRGQLASAASASDGAGLVRTNRLLNYAAGTLGYENNIRVHIRQFAGFVGDGVADDTAVLQGALDFMSLTRGKGVLDAEGCRIRVTSKITIPSWVLLRGAGWLPDPSNGAQSFDTAIYVDWGAGADNHAIELSHSSGIEGFTLYYPGQVAKTAATPTQFGYTLSTPVSAGVKDNISIKNITLYNSYKGIRLENAGRFRVENVQGDPLYIGFYADQCLDTCYMSGVHFWDFYTQANTLETWVAANGSGFLFNRIDQLFASKLMCWNRLTAYYCGSGFWGNLTDIVCDKADNPFIVQNATQVSVNGFVFICNGNVKPAIWGIGVGECARFSNGRITNTACVGAQLDAGALYSFSNVTFSSRHASIVNIGATEVRADASCSFVIPPFGLGVYVDGQPLPAKDTAVTLPSPTLGAGASAITGGYKFPLDSVAAPNIYYDITTLTQRCGLYTLEFTLTSSGTISTAWYFQFIVAKDIGSDINTAFNPLVPFILNGMSSGVTVRIPFHVNHARFKTVLRLRVEATSAAASGAYVSATNIVLYDQQSKKITDAQVGMMLKRNYCLDPLGKGQTVSAKGKARRIITEPEAGIGRAGATPTAGVWEVGDEILLDTPVSGSSPGVVCTTAGDFAGTPPTFKAYANIA